MTQQDELFEHQSPAPKRQTTRRVSAGTHARKNPDQLEAFPNEVPQGYVAPDKEFLCYCSEQIAKRAYSQDRLDISLKALEVVAKLQGHFAPKQVDVNDITPPKTREDHERELQRFGIDPQAIIRSVMQH